VAGATLALIANRGRGVIEGYAQFHASGRFDAKRLANCCPVDQADQVQKGQLRRLQSSAVLVGKIYSARFDPTLKIAICKKKQNKSICCENLAAGGTEHASLLCVSVMTAF